MQPTLNLTPAQFLHINAIVLYYIDFRKRENLSKKESQIRNYFTTAEEINSHWRKLYVQKEVYYTIGV